jgi:hypothetical protein
VLLLPSQREVVVAQPSFAAGKLSDALGDAFLALEARMNDPATRAELLCLRQGACSISCVRANAFCTAMCVVPALPAPRPRTSLRAAL